MSKLPNKIIDVEIDEITTQSFQNYDEAIICWQISIKISAALILTTRIDHIIKQLKLRNDYLNTSEQLTINNAFQYFMIKPILQIS